MSGASSAKAQQMVEVTYPIGAPYKNDYSAATTTIWLDTERAAKLYADLGIALGLTS